MDWNLDNTLLVLKNNKFNSKLPFIGFDYDYTLVKPKSGKKWPKDENDWEYISNKVKGKLKSIKNANIIILTNQKNLLKNSSRKLSCDQWKTKIEQMLKDLNLNISIIASVEDDWNRKPRLGMYEYIKKEFYNDNKKFDTIEHIYVGDAAGRKNDFSASDYKFALNCGIKFMTEIEYFDEEKDKYSKPEYPKSTGKLNKNIIKFMDRTMIIMIGPPASGKSFISKELCNKYNYVRINRDTLKTMKRCEKETEKALKELKSVVIDNTNPDEKSRKSFVDLANKYKFDIKYYIMETPRETCQHNNLYRHYIEKQEKISEIVYRIFYKKLEVPRDAIKIPFELDNKPNYEFYFE